MRTPVSRTILLCRSARTLGGFALALALLFPSAALAQTVLYRVNVGGPQLPALDAGPAWSQDQNLPNASPYVNAAAIGDQIFGSSAPLGPPHVSVPSYVPSGVFTFERWDPGSAPEMKWEFPVGPGTYRINLFLAEAYSGTQFVGARTTDVVVEGVVRLDDYDIYAHFGGYTPGMETIVVAVNDGSLSMEFLHGADDPAVRGIEIVAVSSSGALGLSPPAVDFGTRLVGTLSPPRDVTVTNLGSPGDPDVQITGFSISAGFTHNLSPQALEPGESRTFQVRFQPASAGPATGSLTVTHDGANNPLTLALEGEGVTSFPVGFGKSTLAGAALENPTSLQFGPDGRLYVAQRNGWIRAHTISRNAANAYVVGAAEAIGLIRDLPNHNDDGTLNAGVTDRLVTGLLVTGTANDPVVYVTSSDPRMNVAGDINLDTNSGILSRLQKVAGHWTRTDLVRGLPRSENDHCTNGMALDTLSNTLYVAQGGNANMGAPSLNFSFLMEYALAAAILSVDLDAIGNTTYDIPTLDDETRAGVNDANDPFGGNDGLNQARIVPGGPVQVHSPGWRNPFDVLVHSSGRLYSVDNGPNAGWGGPPIACGNADNDNNSASLEDNLHLIPAAGFYAGHPNPTRASTSNTFNASNPQSPVPAGNPVECTYVVPGNDGSLVRWNTSTNGLTEYRAGNFGGALQGSLMMVSFDNTLTRVALDAQGDSATTVETLFSNIGFVPLDVTSQGDGELFRGTVWVADYVGNSIVVFEPSDYDGGGTICTGADDAQLDEDGDGYTNSDELDNTTNPCSAADVPADFDADLLSDRNDPDDDNDGTLDPDDAFARDAGNGAAVTIPLLYSWDGGNPGFGLFTLGFTGLMANGATDYLDQYDIANLTPGGAAGKLTVDQVSAGDALGALNSQLNGFQFGVSSDSTTAPFTVRTQLSSPWFGGAPADSQAAGLFIGTGMQDDYLSVSVSAGGGEAKIKVRFENGDIPTEQEYPLPGILGSLGVELALDVDPAAGAVRPFARLTGGPRVAIGAALPLAEGSGLREAVREGRPMAVGILSTSRGAAPFTATWDFIEVSFTPTLDAPAPSRPRVTRLLPVTPHPMRSAGLLRFELASAGPVQLDLHALDGRRVRRLASGVRPAGLHTLRWDGRGEDGRRVAPGVYFAKLTTGSGGDAARIVVLE